MFKKSLVFWIVGCLGMGSLVTVGIVNHVRLLSELNSLREELQDQEYSFLYSLSKVIFGYLSLKDKEHIKDKNVISWLGEKFGDTSMKEDRLENFVKLCNFRLQLEKQENLINNFSALCFLNKGVGAENKGKISHLANEFPSTKEIQSTFENFDLNNKQLFMKSKESFGGFAQYLVEKLPVSSSSRQ